MRFLSTSEVAKRLGKSVSTVNRLAKDGAIPVASQAPGVRGPRMFEEQVIEDYAEERAS